jgi:hypothetical protein
LRIWVAGVDSRWHPSSLRAKRSNPASLRPDKAGLLPPTLSGASADWQPGVACKRRRVVASLLAMTRRHARSFSRHDLPEVLQIRWPSLNRGRREDRAPTAPAAPCAMGSKKTHTGLTGTARTSRPSPRNGFTAYTCSSRGAAFLAPVACRDLPASVAPGSRRQNHTISPYAAAFSPGTEAPDAASVHRNPRHVS